MVDTSFQNFIMEVVDETWYKDLEEPDTFYTDVPALKLLDHLTKLCSGLHTSDAVDIFQVVKSLFSDAKGILQNTKAMEVSQRNPSGQKSSFMTIICTMWR